MPMQRRFLDSELVLTLSWTARKAIQNLTFSTGSASQANKLTLAGSMSTCTQRHGDETILAGW